MLHFPGRGTPVTILHSNGMCAGFYAPLGRILSTRGFDVRALTLPGFKGTPRLEAGRLADLVDHMEPIVRPVTEGGILVGHSLGGMVAFLLATRIPLARLVLLEPAIVPIAALTRFFAHRYRKGAVEVAPGFRNRGPFFTRLCDPDAYPAEAMVLFHENERTTDPTVVPRLLASADDALPLPFDRVTCPVTLVRGTHSGVVMWLAQRLLARRFVDSTRVDIPHAGHWMVFEADHAIADAIALGSVS